MIRAHVELEDDLYACKTQTELNAVKGAARRLRRTGRLPRRTRLALFDSLDELDPTWSVQWVWTHHPPGTGTATLTRHTRRKGDEGPFRVYSTRQVRERDLEWWRALARAWGVVFSTWRVGPKNAPEEIEVHG